MPGQSVEENTDEIRITESKSARATDDAKTISKVIICGRQTVCQARPGNVGDAIKNGP